MARERDEVEQPLRHVLRGAATSSCAVVDELALLGGRARPGRGRSSSTAMRSEVSGVRELVRQRRHRAARAAPPGRAGR